MTIEETLEAIRREVDKRTRISKIDNMIDPPCKEEVDAAIYDAVADINAYEPRTDFTVASIGADPDKRWFRAVTLGAARNTIQTLLLDWTAQGISVDLGDGVSLESRLGDYQTLESTLTERFDDLVTKLKASTERHTNVRTFRTIGMGSQRGQSLGKRAAIHNKSNRL